MQKDPFHIQSNWPPGMKRIKSMKYKHRAHYVIHKDLSGKKTNSRQIFFIAGYC